MPLYARNRTNLPLTLAAGTGPPVLTAFGSLDVTTALSGLTGPNYAALEVQRAAGLVRFDWTDLVQYDTATLVTTGVMGHAVRHPSGAQDAIAVATASVAGLESAADKTKLDAVRALATSAMVHWGNSDIGSTTTTRYLTPGFDAVIASSAAIQIDTPFAGTLKSFRVRHGTGAGNGANIVYTVRKNGVATAITVTLASTGTSVSDLVNSVAVAAGDRLDIEVTKAGTIVTSPVNVTATLEIAA